MEPSGSVKNSMPPRSLFARAVYFWVGFCRRYPYGILLTFMLGSSLLIAPARKIRLDTDFKKLLPQTYPTVKAMDTAIAKVGDLGYFSVVVTGGTQEESIRYILALAKVLEQHPDVRMVEYENPVDFLQTYFFHLLPREDLVRVRDYLLKRKTQANPFLVDLEDEEEDAASPASTQEQDEATLDDALEQYRKICELSSYHVSADGAVVALRVRTRRPVTHLRFVDRMYRDLLRICGEVKEREHFSSGLVVQVGGSLRNKLVEYRVVLRDVYGSGVVAAILVLAVLLVYFRSLPALGVLLLPLMTGLLWTGAGTALTIGYLNIISATLFTVLFGLGIDHGIHLLRRYLSERDSGRGLEEALTLAFSRTGRATLVSGLTTAAGFFLLLIADFRGFSQLGLIAGSSMCLILLAYFLLLPPLIVLCNRWNLRLAPRKGRKKAGEEEAVWIRALARFPRKGIWLTAGLLLAAGLVAASLLRFDYDFTQLQGTLPEAEDVKAKQAKVYRETLTPGAVLFAANDQELDGLLQILNQRKEEDKASPTLGRFLSRRTFLPAHPEERQMLMEEIRGLITPLVLRKTKRDDLREALADFREKSLRPAPTWADVPASLRELFVPQDGSDDRILFVFPSIERKHGDKAIEFADDLADLKVNGKAFHATGDSLIMAEMLRAVVAQGLEIIGLSLLCMAGMIWLQMRSLRSMVHIMAALLGGMGLMAILVHLLHLGINFFNMVIVAVVVGMGIDASIHIYSQWAEEMHHARKGGRAAWAAALGKLSGPITASVLTTIAGYVGMVFSSHPGIRSIGHLAVCGLGACFGVSMLVLPLVLRRLEEGRKGR